MTVASTSIARAAALRRRRFVWTALAVAGAGLGAVLSVPAGAEEGRALPAFAAAEAPAPPAAAQETAVIAGGCFWGVQGVFQHVKGVTNAVSGYAGGDERTASYHTVGTGMTGHAEAVKVSFDPKQISYARILQIYFSVAHDPTQLNRQGPDRGTQYRSAIFPVNAGQAAVATTYIAQLDKAHVFPAPIVTRVEPGRAFYAAEDYHQDFLTLNPTYPYIVVNDMPKIAELKRLFPDDYRADPVLVAAAKKAG